LVCDGKASNRGGLLFRCTDCPSTVCESCLPESFEAVDRNEVVAVLGFLSGSIEYIRCSACLTKPPNALYRLLHDNGCISSKVGKPGGSSWSSESVDAGSVKVGSNSDDDLDTPLVLLKSVAQLESGQPKLLEDIDSEDASGPAEIRKRHLETESSPVKSRPTRHCAILGADARFARQLQESKIQTESAGASAQAISPKHPKTPQGAAGEGHSRRRLPGMDDIESRDLAWSSAQTPTQNPPNEPAAAGGIYSKSTSLHFPLILPENGTVLDQIQISSD
jgi:hypothetical protein